MEKNNTNENRSMTAYKSDFEAIYGIITTHRDRVVQQLNGETVMMVWEVGGFVSSKLKTAAWGSGVVRQLAEFIHTQDPTVRGWSYRTIYKMVQFYETYSSPAFVELIGKVKPQLVPVEMAQIQTRPFVPIGLAQIPTSMVAIELKTTEFHPKDLGQLEFYLEALDQEERRSNENPSIGILLCKEANMEVVRFALNRSMSPTMVAQYKEQLQVGGVIQRSLVEFCRFLDNVGEKRK